MFGTFKANYIGVSILAWSIFTLMLAIVPALLLTLVVRKKLSVIAKNKTT